MNHRNFKAVLVLGALSACSPEKLELVEQPNSTDNPDVEIRMDRHSAESIVVDMTSGMLEEYDRQGNLSPDVDALSAIIGFTVAAKIHCDLSRPPYMDELVPVLEIFKDDNESFDGLVAENAADFYIDNNEIFFPDGLTLDTFCVAAGIVYDGKQAFGENNQYGA